ncbi:hypothetical protein ACQCSX_16255 [Pseudarthrobacter sp. P1]|uniref:hypothetical protein n=1 Tax=Pseudarthrobacter sp. P1 TaxID=3418418 RepID=UPI003CEA5CF8
MPSFRAQLQIMGLRPGNAPEAVMDAAVAAVGSIHVVEANQLDLVAGIPRITVRFMVEASEYGAENRQALHAGAGMREEVDAVAVAGRLSVLRRNRGKWMPLG